MRRGAWIGALGGAVLAGAAGATVGARQYRRRAGATAAGELVADPLDLEQGTGSEQIGARSQASSEPSGTDTPDEPDVERVAVGAGLPPWPDGPGRDVRTDDGLRLHVEVAGREDAPVTLVFVHGYGLSRRSFRFQRRDLADDARLVFYDHRSHGASERAPAETCTIDRLGADLQAVLEQVAADRPVVLVGHSMGGMTVLALADRAPELFGSRVVGVALLATSAGRLSEVTLGLPKAAGLLLRRVRPGQLVGLSRTLPLLTALARPRSAARGDRSVTASVVSSVVHRFSFGGDVDPALVTDVETMLGAAGVDVLAAFAPTFLDHDKLAALPTLEQVPVAVLVGEADLMTPVEHSRTIADSLPEAELLVLPEVGHMVTTERPRDVAEALRRLVARALVGSGAGET